MKVVLLDESGFFLDETGIDPEYAGFAATTSTTRGGEDTFKMI